MITNGSEVRGLGIIRLSKSPDPASTSITRQREHIEAFAASQGITVIGIAIDKAVSAFHIPPERRKVFRVWLDRPDEYDCLIYWRQDRLVRRAMDFMGLVTWCKAHGKALYSATEGMGDVTEQAGVLLGFIKAWQSEDESQSTSDRVKDSNKELARQGRWRGGRKIYGSRAVCICHGRQECPDKKAQGWKLEAGGPNLPRCREAVQRVIAGQSVNSICADFNRRGIPAERGGHWQSRALWSILYNRQLLDLGIVTVDEWNKLQAALKVRKANRTVRTTSQSSPLLDIVFCGLCGGKIYRWRQSKTGVYYGRCKNELHRADSATPCNAPRIPYEKLRQLVEVEIAIHADEKIKEPVTNATVKLRLDDIAKELLDLMPDLLAKQIDRDEFIAKQTELMQEQDELEHIDAKKWEETGETVGERWARLDDAQRRVWLLKIGTRYTLHRVGKSWQLRGKLYEGALPTPPEVPATA